MCAAACHHPEVWVGWRAAYCLQITLTLAPSSSQHQDPTHMCLLTSGLSDGWSQHPQQLCPSLLQITVNSGSSVTSSPQTDGTKRCLLMQENICQVRRSCQGRRSRAFPVLQAQPWGLHHFMVFLLVSSAGSACVSVSPFLFGFPAMPTMPKPRQKTFGKPPDNLRTRLSGFLGLTRSNALAEG